MNRHEERLNLVFSIYQALLLKKDFRLTLSNNFQENEIPEFSSQIIDNIILNKIEYISEISNYLVKWSFDRLSYVEQAILLEAMSELKLKLNDKNIVIDEAINIAKDYCDEESYKFINGVLDRV